MEMKILDKRKLRIFLIRNNNLVTFFKLCIVILLIFFMNLNKKFIPYVFYLLIIDLFMLNQKEQKFNKYIVNITIFTMLLVERLLYCSSNFAVIDVMTSILYVFVILIAIKGDLIANRVKYNFSIFDHEFKMNINKSKMLNIFKTIIILTIIISLRINIIIIMFVMFLLFKQICLKDDQLDQNNNTIIDLIAFLILSLSILFKSNSIKIVENTDLAMILLIGTIIATNWIINNKK